MMTCSPESAPSSSCTSSRAARWVDWALRSGSPTGSGRMAAGVLTSMGAPTMRGRPRRAARRDPMLPYAVTVLAARQAAADHGALATIGKVVAEPGGANAISSAVRAWLDARAPDEATLDRVVSEVCAQAEAAAAAYGVEVSVRRESFTARLGFDAGLRDRLASALSARGI